MRKNETLPLVSIIVPIYNVEPYICKCVNSIIAQTYKNLEIILVDDGSQDRCPVICDEYGRKDERVVVIHKSNGGLSDARNAGLDVATGEYITFIDGDDFYESITIQVLVDVAQKYPCDIIKMRFQRVSEDYKSVINPSQNSHKLTQFNSDEYLSGICKKKLSESVCDKLFSARIIESNRFDTSRLNEDFLFLCNLLWNSCTVIEIDYAGYNYYSRPGSISKSGYGKSLYDAVRNSYELMGKALKAKNGYVPLFAQITMYQARAALILIPWKKIVMETDEYKFLLSCMQECCIYLNKSTLKLKDKVTIKAVCVAPKLSLAIIHLLCRIKYGKK